MDRFSKSLTDRAAVSEELGKLWRLAWPVSITFMLNMSLSVVTVMFVGRLGPAKMAACSLGSALALVTGHSVGRGLSSAMNTLCGQSYGAGAYEEVGILLQRGLAIVTIAQLPIIVAWIFAEPLLVWLGQEPGLAAMTAAYLWYRIPGLLLYGAYGCTANYLQAQGIVRPPAIAALITAVCHPLVNYVLIHVMGMDYLGASAALSVAYGLQLAVLLACSFGSKLHEKTWKGWSHQCWHQWGPFLRLAVPGLLLLSELWAIEIGAMLGGLLPSPAQSLSVMSIYMTINGLYFMLPMGIGVAAMTRVAIELGAGHGMAAMWAGHVAITMSTVIMCVLAVPLFLFRGAWARVFTNDPDIARGVSKVLVLLSVSVLFDGIQTTVGGIMRAQGRQAVMVPIVLVSYYLVGLPAAAGLAFRCHLGIVGLCAGLLFGTILHSSIYLVMVARTNWRAAAAKALRDVGITLPTSASVKPHGTTAGCEGEVSHPKSVRLPDLVKSASAPGQIVVGGDEEGAGIETPSDSRDGLGRRRLSEDEGYGESTRLLRS